MADEWSDIPPRARVCPPCNGDCRQGRDCPAHMPNPIDEAWNEGQQVGFDKGISRGIVLTLVFVLVAWLGAALTGVA